MLNSGDKLGPYEILSPLGAGGMGEVYRATDTRLDREVAVKVLPEAMTRDPERVQRFQREAKVLASLNHPNIAAIYGFEEADSKKFLVMELVEGQTLSARLGGGAMPVEEALVVAKQMAEALEAAHEKGIIHRDLKPANVMVDPEGKVKVLDFGLAKAITGEIDASAGMANSPTITADFTRPGVIMGTAAYMSPEQARGKPLDKRTDIWSFGCMLFELLTGERIFGGETSSDAIGAILHKEPDWTTLPPDTPPTIHLLLRRCLAKDRTRRLRDIGDARIELESAIIDPSSSSLNLAGAALTVEGSREGKRKRSGLGWAAVLLLVALGVAASWAIKQPSSPLGRIMAEIPPPPESRLLFAGDVAGPAVVSPDGRMVAFVAQIAGERHQIWLRNLAEPESRPLRGTQEGVFPFWSPDSRSLGFFVPGKMKRIDLATGTTMTLCDAPGGRGGAWLQGDVIVFSPDYQEPLQTVPANGVVPQQVTYLDSTKHTSHRWPAAMGDDEHFLYIAINHDPGKSEHGAIYVGSLDGSPPRRVVQS